MEGSRAEFIYVYSTVPVKGKGHTTIVLERKCTTYIDIFEKQFRIRPLINVEMRKLRVYVIHPIISNIHKDAWENKIRQGRMCTEKDIEHIKPTYYAADLYDLMNIFLFCQRIQV